MAKELKVTGTIDVNQFWPKGASDADTTKIIVAINGFTVRDLTTGQTKVTHLFDTAKVKGSGGTKPAVKNNKMTVRLQGIDAPELHYKAPPLKRNQPGVTPEIREKYNDLNEDFRQFFAETGTVELGKLLGQVGTNPVACEVLTVVDLPNDVFDTYGRFVGDIHVTLANNAVVLNLWLVEKGWVYPAFYNSMKNAEITALRQAASTARPTSPLWQNYTGQIDPLDMNLIFRQGGPPNPAADQGPVIVPKLFRRLVAWTIARKAKVPQTATTFLKALEKIGLKDAFFLTDDFLAQGGNAADLQEFITHFSSAGKFTLDPDEMVFRESSSTLVDANGNEILDWD
jgi:endonuclease YncB( thermonuclease family)